MSITAERRRIIEQAILRLRELAQLERLGEGSTEAGPLAISVVQSQAQLHAAEADRLQAELDEAERLDAS